MCDRTQPAAKANRLTQLTDFLHHLDENVLRQFLSFVEVTQSAHGDGKDSSLKPLEQFAERFFLTSLRRNDQLDDLSLVGFVDKSSHNMKISLTKLFRTQGNLRGNRSVLELNADSQKPLRPRRPSRFHMEN
jgi:hypothetical protein